MEGNTLVRPIFWHYHYFWSHLFIIYKYHIPLFMLRTVATFRTDQNCFTGLHQERAYTYSGISCPECVHQFFCCLVMHIMDKQKGGKWVMGRVQNYNFYIRPSSHEKLLVILCIGSTDLVKVAIVLKCSQTYLPKFY